MTIPPDNAAREQALSPNQSFICEAPAGSGKTELLTQRFLTLLGRVQKPEDILAITFTRKATGEMRERILEALLMGQGLEPQQAHKRKTWGLAQQVLQANNAHDWALLQNPNRLQIKTFDSLCASLARHLPLESTFGAMPQVAEDADELYRKAVRLLLATLESDTPWGDALTVILQLLDNQFDRFENLMAQLLARREQWLPLMAYGASRPQIRIALETALQNVLQDTVESVRQLIPFHRQRELIELAAFAAANLRNQNSTSPLRHCLDMDMYCETLPGWDTDGISKWHGLVSMLMTFAGKWRATVNKKMGFPLGETSDERRAFSERKQQLLSVIDFLQSEAGMAEALRNLRSLPQAQLDTEQWQILDALFTVLPILSAQLTLVFRETNSIDFTELSIGAHRALGNLDEPTQLALKMDYRLSHILVDEFQDTSASQVDLLNLLTAGWSPDDGRTLFCVGDAMQSIYGFRGANVGLFLNCREQGLENVHLQPLRLTANFRSQAGIVEWVNRIFAHAFPQKNSVSTGAVCYSPSDPVLDNLPGKSVWVHGFVDHDDDYMEARTVLGIVRKAQMDNPDVSIAILLRNRNHVSHIVPQLKEAGLRYRAVDLEPLQDHAVVQDLMALVRALLHPADRTAWLSVLRAPWCGLGLVDMEALANFRMTRLKSLPTVLEQCEQSLRLNCPDSTQTRHQNDLFLSEQVADALFEGPALSTDGKVRLQRVLPILRSANNQRERKTLRHWIEGTWLQLGGPACVEDATALENAQVFFRLLAKWEYASDLPSFERLAKTVAKLYASPDPRADEKLQIMTIHKSKGLEFDVIIVPQLQRRPRVNETALLMWHERLNAAGDRELLMAPLTANKNGRQHPTYHHLRSEETKKNEYENCRLLYVACTRAKQQLHLCARLKEDPQNTARLKQPAKTSLLATIWDPVQRHVKRIYPKEMVVATINTSVDKTYVKPRPLFRLAKHWEFPALEEDSPLQAYIPPFDYGEVANRIDLHWRSPALRMVGTVIHLYLQRIAEQGLPSWSVEKVAASRPQVLTSLCIAGVPTFELEDCTQTVVDALCRSLSDSRSRWILDNAHVFSACEYPLTVNGKGETLNLVLDRIFTENNGITWIVDYKTAEPDADETKVDFLSRQQALYREKLALYQRAAQQAGFKSVRCALYFPLSGDWLVMERESELS